MICPMGGDCDAPHNCLRSKCRYISVPPLSALHFVGFKDDRYWNAVRVFGLPDIIHRCWDYRAKAEIMPGDVAVFAVGSIDDEPSPYGWDDSHEDIIAKGGPRDR